MTISDDHLAEIKAHMDQLLSDASVHEAEGRDADAQTNYHAADAIDRLLQEVEALKADREWQPIETAPKDGTAILIYQPNGKREHHMPREALRDGEFSYTIMDKRLQWYDDGRFAIGYWRPWGGWGNRNSAFVECTHWQPLPEPPATEEHSDD